MLTVRNVHYKRFTLVELLVVIAVISILAGMLLPALGKALDSARSIECMNKIKQINMALNMYVDDNEGYFPDPYYEIYYRLASPYLPIELNSLNRYEDNSKILSCPSDEAPAQYRSSGAGTEMFVSYGFNWSQISGKRYTQIKRPSISLVLSDGNGTSGKHLISPYSGVAWQVADRHNGGSNVLFADSSVRWYSYYAITYYEEDIPDYWQVK
jgi:prepilin-type processing-associated H-X9-DG protein/prepilin-type N-terminal cleavage/methylation domain-containing protein